MGIIENLVFFHVLIDDGVNTSLDTKGDGLKNLIAIN